MERCSVMRVIVLAGLVTATLVLASRPATAVLSEPAKPYNILLLLADDLGWTDLPYFSEPTEWATGMTSPSGSGYFNHGEPRMIDASHSRFAARVYAVANGAGIEFGTYLARDGGEYEVEPGDQKFPDDAAPGYSFVAANKLCTDPEFPCQNTDCRQTNFVGKPNVVCTGANHDILNGFGGLARLAREGTIFPRFYANSAKCAPSRAALFSGRYPKRTGVQLNGSILQDTDITIAEFLKQGCSTSGTLVDKKCRKNGAQQNTCGCFLTNGDCSAQACYRTGLVGKWHLGDDANTPWNQGFDEYFGFGGGSRSYWNRSDLQCGPVPGYCANNHEKPCTKATEGTDCPGSECTPRGLYIGTSRGAETSPNSGKFSTVNECVHEDPAALTKPDCCNPVDETVADKRGSYSVISYLGNDVNKAGTGKDRRRVPGVSNTQERPCSDTGLTKNTDCAYSTRVFRDQARNFLVRNATRQPFFLTVSFHAPHFAFQAPLRTEDHYLTAVNGVTKLKPKSPNSATKYWAVLEELDAAVGQIVATLDTTGVCKDDSSISCTPQNEGTTCGGTNQCLPMGTCREDPSDSPAVCFSESDCGAAGVGGACDPLSARTLVLFVGDQGRNHSTAPYGNPSLNGGKGNVYEGGVRVGIVARHPRGKQAAPTVCSQTLTSCNSNADCESPPSGVCTETMYCSTSLNECTKDYPCADARESCLRSFENPAIGSIVDIFATIADAAGYPMSADHVAWSSKLCSGGDRDACSVDGDCTTNGNSGTCVQTPVVDGVSFLGQLEGLPSLSEAPHIRNWAFASYPGDGLTVLAADDQVRTSSTGGLCVYSPAPSSDGRRVRGASCEPCASNSDCTSTTTWCKLPGRVCIDEAGKEPSCPNGIEGVCMQSTYGFSRTGPPERNYYRCDGSNEGCPGNSTCKADVWIRCDRCDTGPQRWKLKAPDSGGVVGDTKGLYELRTNPGEEKGLNCQGEEPEEPPVDESLLRGKLITWLDAIDDGDPGTPAPE